MFVNKLVFPFLKNKCTYATDMHPKEEINLIKNSLDRSVTFVSMPSPAAVCVWRRASQVAWHTHTHTRSAEHAVTLRVLQSVKDTG